MIGSRHIGYFIMHTIKPLIEELDKVLSKCKVLNLNKYDLQKMINRIIELEICKSLIYCFFYSFMAIMICLTVYFILR